MFYPLYSRSFDTATALLPNKHLVYLNVVVHLKTISFKHYPSEEQNGVFVPRADSV